MGRDGVVPGYSTDHRGTATQVQHSVYIQYIQRLTVKLSVACLEGVDIQLSYSMSPVQCQMGSAELCSWVAVKGYITHPYTTYVVLGKGIIQNIVGG